MQLVPQKREKQKNIFKVKLINPFCLEWNIPLETLLQYSVGLFDLFILWLLSLSSDICQECRRQQRETKFRGYISRSFGSGEGPRPPVPPGRCMPRRARRRVAVSSSSWKSSAKEPKRCKCLGTEHQICYMHIYIYIYIYIHMYTCVCVLYMSIYIYRYIHTFITLHYITLHYITLHYITLHYITLHYITLHYITYIQMCVCVLQI